MSKPIILKLKTHPNQDPKAEINYIIKGDFPRHYNEEDREKDINKEVKHFIMYN